MENNLLNNEKTPAAKPMLGEVAQCGLDNYYTVVIIYDGKEYKWTAVRSKNLVFHYTKEVWSNDTYGLKKSIKKKMKQMVEDAVSNLA